MFTDLELDLWKTGANGFSFSLWRGEIGFYLYLWIGLDCRGVDKRDLRWETMKRREDNQPDKIKIKIP
jgi:hypothetical protein